MTVSLNLPICVLPHGQTNPLPTYQTSQSAGMDLHAAISEEIILEPGHRHLIPTGIAFALPNGYEAQIRSRSGLSVKHGVIVLNAPATIDSDHRGEIRVVLINLGQDSFSVQPGMRIAQLIIAPYTQTSWNLVPSLEDYPTERDISGFGSTGL
ncbi:MAG: deoxyuridine 5'-triphosphate nucleotidohydrolase [Alphaproteobacteria bacterium RIFCSPHIGHO2_01_FULL_41_14]|nr:MAG: deoxyuridine 5'-triphosphate nucleotidohydrolase [Alphaproteobacteria bacterium GWA1_45_9]OFW89446.1 MAG: deoxyuridine 5'-triphosphate nucleotidohydrolase [Alphaproteobacteria bacterium RIFCSPHIGHO2_01_FULL_41_14]